MGPVRSALWRRPRPRPCPYVSSCERRTQKPETDGYLSGLFVLCGSALHNSDPFNAVEGGEEILGNVMEALDDSNTHLIGVYGSNARITHALLARVHRRAERDELFDLVVKATVTRKPDVGKIQEDIARELHFTFSQKSKAKRAKELIHRIRNEPKKILIVLYDLYKKLDLSKVGIPYGADHTGCKIILTSTTEDVLSKHMHTQKNFKI